MEGPAGPGRTAPSPCGRGDGVAPAQPRPAARPPSRCRHGPLRLGRCRPSSFPWPATAGAAPPPPARCRAPGTAGRRGCRTAARGHGRPGSASRRSGGCTDGGRRASASCICGPCRSPSRAGCLSPRAGASSDGSRGLTALGLVAGLRPPTEPAGTAKPEPHRAPTVLPAGRACRARPGRLTPRRNGRRILHRGGLDRPVASGAARVGLVGPTKQVVMVRLGRSRSAGGSQRAGSEPQRACAETWSNTSMTRNGNQVRVLDPAHRRLTKLRTR
jgi:hypothetical protein